MGNLKYFSLLMAAGMFAACSDNLENAGNGNEGDTLTGEKGYVNIGINLPTTNGSSRVPYSDNFDDGEESEYKVNEVIIALFYGANEASATCQYAFKLTKNDFSLSGDDDDNITSYYASGVRMIAAPERGSVYALALVNPPATFGISGTQQGDEDGGNSVLTTTLTVSGVTNSGTTKPTLEQLNQALTISAISDVVGETGTPDFFMTNAPIANQSTYVYAETTPTDFEVTTLAPVIIHNSKAAAEAAANDSPIYVERVVAKAQVNIGNNGSNNTDNDNTMNVTSDVPSYANATVTFEGWKLQTTNKKYYPVRRVNKLSSGETSVEDWKDWSKYTPNTTSISNQNNRFFGNTQNPYRTYWGIDPNYTTETSINDDYNVLTSIADDDWNSVGYGSTESAIEYCLENTTTAQTMESERLTSVLLKGTFKPNGTSTGADADFFMKDNTSAIYTADQLLTWATDVLNKSEEDGVKLGTSETITYKSQMPAVGTTITDAAGILTLFDIPGTTGEGNVQDKRADALIAAAGNNIKYYKGGVTYYYATVIEHFGPDAPATEINSATNYTEANHLGRYGVLRNNWYVLTINSVSGPGEPDVPDGGGVNPPDKQQSYINCEINILSWAKRTQGVEL